MNAGHLQTAHWFEPSRLSNQAMDEGRRVYFSEIEKAGEGKPAGAKKR